MPAGRKIDGKDMSPLLFGKTTESPHEARYYYKGYKLEAVRSGPWKLALGPQLDGTGKKEPPADAAKPGVRLYNLDKEIGERTDVAAENPDVVKRLQSLAAKMAEELGDGKPGPGVRPAGNVANHKVLYPAEQPAPKKKDGKMPEKK